MRCHRLWHHTWNPREENRATPLASVFALIADVSNFTYRVLT